MRLGLIAAAVMLVSGQARADDRCVSYEPEIVTLTGTVHAAIAYGPPGFGETPSRDAREKYESLTLDRPLCVLQGDDDLDAGESGVRQVQLVSSKPLVQWSGKHLSATGTLFHQISSHHHTKVLLQVGRID